MHKLYWNNSRQRCTISVDDFVPESVVIEYPVKHGLAAELHDSKGLVGQNISRTFDFSIISVLVYALDICEPNYLIMRYYFISFGHKSRSLSYLRQFNYQCATFSYIWSTYSLHVVHVCIVTDCVHVAETSQFTI